MIISSSAGRLLKLEEGLTAHQQQIQGSRGSEAQISISWMGGEGSFLSFLNSAIQGALRDT